jgi:hypothetical protein
VLRLVRGGGSVLALLLVGVAGGLATVLLHQRGWGLLLGLAAAAACTRALPRGWARVGFMLGWMGAVGWAMAPRPEGDYLVPGNLLGYAMLVGSFVLLLVALATSGPTRGSRDDPGDSPSPT